MRRHRAKLQGQDPTETTDDMTFPGRLKPGRKSKTVDTPTPSQTRGSDTESDDQLPTKKHSQRGLTLPYKLKAILANLASMLHICVPRGWTSSISVRWPT